MRGVSGLVPLKLTAGERGNAYCLDVTPCPREICAFASGLAAAGMLRQHVLYEDRGSQRRRSRGLQRI